MSPNFLFLFISESSLALLCTILTHLSFVALQSNDSVNAVRKRIEAWRRPRDATNSTLPWSTSFSIQKRRKFKVRTRKLTWAKFQLKCKNHLELTQTKIEQVKLSNFNFVPAVLCCENCSLKLYKMLRRQKSESKSTVGFRRGAFEVRWSFFHW